MKPISCNQEMGVKHNFRNRKKKERKKEMGDTERLLCPGAPQRPAWYQSLGRPHVLRQGWSRESCILLPLVGNKKARWLVGRIR